MQKHPPSKPTNLTPMPIREPRPGARLPVALLVLLAVVALLTPSIALGEAPQQLTQRVTDLSGVMSDDDAAQAESAIADLDDEENVQLFVLFVNTLDGATVTDYADETAALSSLAGNDALLVVAIEDRLTALWVGDSLDGVSDDEIQSIIDQRVTPNLQDGAPEPAARRVGWSGRSGSRGHRRRPGNRG
jgi:uncharacterized membrane protein YgcG